MSTKSSKEYLFNTKSEEFNKAQANILLTDTMNNKFMPEDPRISKNQALNTTKKNVVGAINEVFDMASQAMSNAGLTGDYVKTINGNKPDSTGNMSLKVVERAMYDSKGRRFEETYLTHDAISDLNQGSARTVNGIKPDAQGNIIIDIVKSINGVHPDSKGNIPIDLSPYIKKDGFVNDLRAILNNRQMKLYTLTVNGNAPGEDGDIKVSYVEQAGKTSNADYATRAGSAVSADKASQAISATNADVSDKAIHDDKGNVISLVYMTKDDLEQTKNEILSEGFGGMGRTLVFSINGVAPDDSGNIDIPSIGNADMAEKDAIGRNIVSTYATKEELAAIAASGGNTGEGGTSASVIVDSGVKAVNGILPDENGNVVISQVSNDGNGHNIAETYAKKSDVYTIEAMDDKLGKLERLYNESNMSPDDLAQGSAFSSRYVSVTNHNLLVQRVASLEERIRALENDAALSGGIGGGVTIGEDPMSKPFAGTMFGIATGNENSNGDFVPDGSTYDIREFAAGNSFVYTADTSKISNGSAYYRIFTTLPNVRQGGFPMACRPCNSRLSLSNRYSGYQLYWVGQHTSTDASMPSIQNA